jgi:hypothetical protein
MICVDLHTPVLHTSVLREFFQSFVLMLIYRLKFTVGRHVVEDILPTEYVLALGTSLSTS